MNGSCHLHTRRVGLLVVFVIREWLVKILLFGCIFLIKFRQLSFT